eukprot:m.367747 g.367747  ORF g.367747 m.367747 type:complete len:323 (+) comp56087_c1_seq5:178-1146(+)
MWNLTRASLSATNNIARQLRINLLPQGAAALRLAACLRHKSDVSKACLLQVPDPAFPAARFAAQFARLSRRALTSPPDISVADLLKENKILKAEKANLEARVHAFETSLKTIIANSPPRLSVLIKQNVALAIENEVLKREIKDLQDAVKKLEAQVEDQVKVNKDQAKMNKDQVKVNEDQDKMLKTMQASIDKLRLEAKTRLDMQKIRDLLDAIFATLAPKNVKQAQFFNPEHPFRLKDHYGILEANDLLWASAFIADVGASMLPWSSSRIKRAPLKVTEATATQEITVFALPDEDKAPALRFAKLLARSKGFAATEASGPAS